MRGGWKRDARYGRSGGAASLHILTSIALRRRRVGRCACAVFLRAPSLRVRAGTVSGSALSRGPTQLPAAVSVPQGPPRPAAAPAVGGCARVRRHTVNTMESGPVRALIDEAVDRLRCATPPALRSHSSATAPRSFPARLAPLCSVCTHCTARTPPVRTRRRQGAMRRGRADAVPVRVVQRRGSACERPARVQTSPRAARRTLAQRAQAAPPRASILAAALRASGEAANCSTEENSTSGLLLRIPAACITVRTTMRRSSNREGWEA